MLLPFLPSEPFESPLAHIVLVRTLSVWLVGQLHGRHDAVCDQSGAEPGAQAQKEHHAALIAPQRLHGRIIDELDGIPEGSLEVKPDPTRAEVMRFGHHVTLEYQPRVAYRYHIIRPLPGELLDSGNHLCGRQFWPGGKFPRFGLSSGEDLHVGPADINNQHVHGASSPCAASVSHNHCSRATLARQLAVRSTSWPAPGQRSWSRAPP